MRRVIPAALALAMIAASCSGGGADTTTTTTTAGPTAPTTLAPPPVTTAAPLPTTPPTAVPPAQAQLASLPRPGAMSPFATFPDIPLIADEPAYGGPSTPGSLADAAISPSLEAELANPALRDALAANGFAIVPGTLRLFHQAYLTSDYEPYPVFVTIDAAYHVWHLAFSKVLRDAEEQRMLPILEELTEGLLAAARAQTDELAGTPLADDARRVEEWFQAAAVLLGHDAGGLGERAAAEVALAEAAADVESSPITSTEPCRPDVSAAFCVDYSQFKPRGHYTRSEDLSRYFRAMSLYGQSGFFADEPGSLRLGALVARLLAADLDLAGLWRALYEPTAFLVGLADDYTPFEVALAAEAAAPGSLAGPAPLADDATMAAVAARLAGQREVRINPEAAAMRVMGARFVIDSFVLDQLTWPNVGTEDDRRVRPSPLDLAAAFGSAFAYGIQDAAGETAYQNYDAQLDEMRAELAARSIADWAATVYDAWLHALEPMWAPHGMAYPDFMRTDAWAAKAHQTGFGSYTELKHDTILYAKQGFAAEGGGDPPAFEPRHWVEPEPVAFGRLRAVVDLARDGLNARDLLPDAQDELLAELSDFLGRLERIATDELAGLPISDDDNDWLEGVGHWLEWFWLASADFDEETGVPAPGDEDVALVADIFRSTFGILELGTGRVDLIYVLVPDDAGGFQVARGGVYSYYEFVSPADLGRLTDEEWRRLLDGGEAPERPGWQAAFLVEGGEPAAGAGDLPPGLFCRDLAAQGLDYTAAHAYWVAEGSPDRMDADRNGVPCETVYPAEEVAAFLGGG